ncbi:MAG: arginine--tRNA ligase [Polyangiales bacterium]
MADPLSTLIPVFRAAIGAAYGAEHSAVDPMIRTSQHADYQANAALGLAKALKKAPRDVATAIAAQLPAVPGGDAIERTEVSGPGFINLWLRDEALDRALVESDATLGLHRPAHAERVVIDYSGPNVAKEMHVGHLRSTILGDALARIFEALGHTVIRQNHLGDWGTNFGMLIEHLIDIGADELDASIRDLNAFYQAARQKFDGDPAFADRARQRVVSLQSGDSETLEHWRVLIESSRRYMAKVYEALDVTLTDNDIAGESLYNPMLEMGVEELLSKGLAIEDDGAICVFPPGFVGRDDRPLPLIVRKREGGYGYATTDVCAVKYRTGTLEGTRLLYVIGAPQAQHLAMVFKTAQLAGWLAPPARAEHVMFGSVLGPDRKMFKTRSGETVRLLDLLDEAVARALVVVEEKSPELDAETRAAVARAVGIGCVKYADLSSDRVKDYVFDLDRMISFEGNTGAYLQYACARPRSILRRANADVPLASTVAVKAPAERALAMKLLAFPTALAEVEQTLQPHKLCGYLYDLATAFSAFFESCPVLKADEATKASRLALCDRTARTLARGLDLLGIRAPERM